MLKLFKVKAGRFYVNQFFWIALILSIAILIYGSIVILISSGEPSEILTKFAGFAGGMATVVAALVAIREFILFRHNQGVKEFRELFSDKLKTLPGYVLSRADEAYSLFSKVDCVVEDGIKKEGAVQEMKELAVSLKELRDDVSLSHYSLSAGVDDIHSMSAYLEVMIGEKAIRLVRILKELNDAIFNYELRVEFYVTTASKLSGNTFGADYVVNKENEFISSYFAIGYKSYGNLIHREPQLLGSNNKTVIGEVFRLTKELEKLKIT
jgi:hypothetical protein